MAFDGQKSSNSTPAKKTQNDTSTPQVVSQPALVPSLLSKPVEIPQFTSPSTSNISKGKNSVPPAEANTNGEIPFTEVIRGVSNPGLNPISTPTIQINNNQYEVLQDNDNEYSESEDGKIKEVSTSSLLEFGSISQPVTILQKEKVITQYIPEKIENSKVSGKKKPPLKPVVVTRKASKRGGRSPLKSAMSDFNDFVDACGLIQAPKSGLEFSWCNGRVGNKRILCNLDRALFNLKWIDTFSGWHYHVAARGISDHGPLIGSDTLIGRALNTPFRFQQMWLTHPSFLQMVIDSWNEDITGNLIFIFMNKLKRPKKILKIWNWEVFGNVQENLKKDEDKVMEETIKSGVDPANIFLLNKMVTARGNYEIAANNYNTFLRDKARLNWIKDGDVNSKFFHTSIKMRQAQNTIPELENDSGNIITTQGISKILIDYFKKKFEYQSVQINESIFDVASHLISEADNCVLEECPNEEEIKHVVFNLNVDSAPDPDGFTGIFYRAAWEIVKDNLVDVIQFCWRYNIIPSGMNSNFLVLIPKIKGAKTAKSFRPIGLSNFCFKIITKMITERLTRYLPNLISQQQYAFVKNRNIHEQILLDSELVNEMSTIRRRGNVGLKLDISQAYDIMSWEFLYRALKKIGFSAKFCNWIMVLLQSAKLSIMLNGGPIGFFGVGRALNRETHFLQSCLF
ncbi:uncharacterized protein LOC113312071 [Papaver somniferum]|uniref:uncharacterized protein LOC113312071 n=1 Tax=Papaver somniferum TaxID=3469 RepID=UPI000E6FE3E5|nr:uncharacterized protein LOC113312071 [Papaver somniferum]